jgi:glycosyltransferase involved in cell wall biosynthesis
MGFETRPETRPETPGEDWLFMGRLVPIKGLDLAIEAFSRAELPPSTRLHIAGDGPLRASYQAMEHPNIVFHGFVTGANKEALLNTCAFFLLTSKTLATGRHEGLPVSLLEVSDRGLIPLTTDIPGIATHLASPALQHFADRDPNLWAQRIESMATLDETTRTALAQATRAKVAPLRWQNLGPVWNELVLSCV